MGVTAAGYASSLSPVVANPGVSDGLYHHLPHAAKSLASAVAVHTAGDEDRIGGGQCLRHNVAIGHQNRARQRLVQYPAGNEEAHAGAVLVAVLDARHHTAALEAGLVPRQ
jgi:hypothetical protein